MAPDGIRALVRITSRLVAAGMDDLEVVDVAIGLIEVAVAIIVVAIPLVEGLQIIRDLRWVLPAAS